METDRANEQARIQLVGCGRHACVLVQGAWVCAVCGRLVHLRVMCAEACGGVLRTVWRGLAFGLESFRRGVGFLLHVEVASRWILAVVLPGLLLGRSHASRSCWLVLVVRQC